MVEKSRILLENPKSILNLNTFCLFAILNQIKNNCELGKTKDRYRELIYFATSNDYICSVFLDWSDDLLAILEVKIGILMSSKTVYLDLAEIYKRIKQYTASEKVKFWDTLCISLTENADIKSCALKYVTEAYYPEHMEALERITEILKTKEKLTQLSILMPTYSTRNLENFRNLHFLGLATPMEAEALVDCIRSNPNLERLVFFSTEIYGRLADIAPYSKNIRILNIEMKPDSNAVEYAPLAQLPKLGNLRLCGSPQTDSLGALFKSMAENGSRTLMSLTVDQPIISGIEELSKLLHLQKLECELKEPPLELSPTHSWQWPIVYALDMNISSSEDKKKDHISVDILSRSGTLLLVSEDIILIRQIVLRLKNWCENHRQDSNFESAPMWFELNEMRSTIENLRSKNIRDSKDITKIATFALLKALENQWPTHARNIEVLAGIRDLKELRVKVKLNIERELRRLEESDIRLHMEGFEKEISVDSEIQEIMYLALLTYLSDTFVRSKFTRLRTDIAVRNLKMEINFDIRP